MLEQVELGGREDDLVAGDEDLPLLRQQPHLPEDEGLVVGPQRVAGAAAQDAGDPGHDLARAERLGDVVVRAELEPDDTAHLVVEGGEEDDRRPVTGGAQRPAHLDPVELGQADVEQDDVGPALADDVEGHPTVARGGHPVPRHLELELEHR